jgi:hypothetical protein
VPSIYPSYVLPAGAGNLPETAEALTGADVTSDYWSRVAGLYHATHARGQLWRWGQSWTGGVCRLGAADGVLTHPMRVPLVSSQHAKILCRAYCAHTIGAGASLRWVSSAGNSVVAVPALGAPAWVTASLQIPVAGVYDDVYVETVGLAAGVEVTVYDISLEVEPLGSPLAAATPSLPYGSGLWRPVGSTTLGPDYPLPASRTRALAQGVADYYRRPRPLYCWVGVYDDVSLYVGASTALGYQQRRPNRLAPRLVDAADPLARTGTVWAYVTRAAATTYLRVARVGRDGLPLVDEIPVAAGVGRAWVTGTIDLSVARPLVGLTTVRHVGIEVYPSDATANAPHSTCRVHSVSIWGP